MTTTATTTRVPTIETVGAIVRGPYGQLARITEVIESSRLSDRHIMSPGDVVVRLEQVGPGYGHTSAYASELTLAEPGDVGSHPHRTGCECGHPYTGPQYYSWIHMPATWAV